MKDSQSIQILNDLMTGSRITALEALHRYGCLRLAARISELRKEGFNILSDTIISESGKRVAQYYIQP